MSDRRWQDDEEDWSETGGDYSEDDADDDDGDADSLPCPDCGASIYADLDHCPQCGYWITDVDHRNLDRDTFPSRGVRIVTIVMLVIFVFVLLVGMVRSF